MTCWESIALDFHLCAECFVLRINQAGSSMCISEDFLVVIFLALTFILSLFYYIERGRIYIL